MPRRRAKSGSPLPAGNAAVQPANAEFVSAETSQAYADGSMT